MGADAPPPSPRCHRTFQTSTQVWFLLSGAAGTFFFPFVPVFLSSRGMTSSQLGVLAAVRPWLAAPTSLAATTVADRLRLHRPLLVASLVASTVMRAALPLLPGLTALSGLLLASEILGAPTGVVADATILSRCRTVRGRHAWPRRPAKHPMHSIACRHSAAPGDGR